jgi:ABC-type molybdate transport system substrate-binding protein
MTAAARPKGSSMPPGTHDLPVIPDERGDDLHGLEIADQADLVVFMAGNQFMVMPRLMEAFRAHHPAIRHIFCETLPPKIELRQILAGGAVFRGQVVAAAPDVYTAVSADSVAALARAERVDPARCFVYLHNRLALMVAADNPRAIASLHDLAKPGIRISQPNPQHEDIAEHILQMYREAGGEALLNRIMEDKQQAGETRLTTVHHRETPRWLMEGRVDVGPVWATEIAHAEREGLPLAGVALGAALDQREAVRYVACPVRGGRNPANGAAFLAFLQSGRARRIYADFGFTPAKP